MPKLNTRHLSATAQKWVKRGVAFVVTLGAVAGAITAVTALWPEADPPDAVDRAELSVTVRPRVPLSQYARLASAQPQGFRMQPTDEPVIVEPTEGPIVDPTDVPTVEPTEEMSEVPSSGVEESFPVSTTPEEPGENRRQVPNTEIVEKVCDEIDTPVDECEKPIQGIVESVAKDENNEPVDPVVAARRVVKILEDSQQTAAHEPLGAIVIVKADLIGLRDRPVLLTWAMWHKEGGDRLHEEWLNERLAYELRASTDNDSTVARLWIPLPKIPGPYLVGVTATVDGAPLTSSEAEFG